MDINNAYELIIEKLEWWVRAIISMLPNIALAVLVIVLAGYLARLTEKLSGRLIGRFSSHKTLNNLFGNFLKLTVLGVGIFIALTVLNLDGVVVSLVAGVGVVGLALAFAFQDIASNFMSGIFLAIRRPMRVMDIIESGDNMGVVQQITLRDTVLINFQGQEIFIPNKDVFQSVIKNYSTLGLRRVDLKVGVSYGEDLRRVREITLNAIEGKEYLSKKRTDVTLYFNEFGDSSINFTIRYWVDFKTQLDYLTALSEGIIDIKEAYDEADIMIPFPIRTLDFGIKGGKKLSEMKLNLDKENGENPAA